MHFPARASSQQLSAYRKCIQRALVVSKCCGVIKSLHESQSDVHVQAHLSCLLVSARTIYHGLLSCIIPSSHHAHARLSMVQCAKSTMEHTALSPIGYPLSVYEWFPSPFCITCLQEAMVHHHTLLRKDVRCSCPCEPWAVTSSTTA